MCAADAETHRFENAGNAVADGRGGREREVEDAEGDTEASRRFLADEFAGAGDFEGGFF